MITMLDNIREKETLPVGIDDHDLPTRIAKQDEHVKFLREQHEILIRTIAEAEIDRDLLIKRAKEVCILEDDKYKLVDEPVYPKKHVDVEVLKKLCPTEHAQIVANLTAKAQQKLQDQMAKIQVTISQADVKAIIGSKSLLVQIIPEPKEPSYYNTVVVKK